MILGVNTDWNNPSGSPGPSVLFDSTVRMARFVFKDTSDWQTSGSLPSQPAVFRHLNVVHHLRARGVGSLIILNGESFPGYSPALDDEDWDLYLGEFVERVRSIASVLCPEVVFEVWNEPDQGNNMSATRYGVLLREAYKAVKSVSPSLVITAGLSSGQPKYLKDASAAAGGLFCDGVGVHPYGQRGDSYPSAPWGFGSMRSLLGAYATESGKPIWVTEFGTNDSTIDQSRYLTDCCQTMASMPSVAAAFWFCWSDGMVPGFGLMDAAGMQKPSYTAFHSAPR